MTLTCSTEGPAQPIHSALLVIESSGSQGASEHREECNHRCFALHPKAKYWSTTMNGKQSPHDATIGTTRKFWFDCAVCCHSFDVALSNLSRGDWCPFCSNKRRCPPTTIQTCAQCWNKCFASHPKAAQWSSRNKTLPRELALKSDRKCWFECEKCNHHFQATLDKVVEGRWCPFCYNKRRCPPSTIQDCARCWNGTFASHPKAKCWSNKRNEKHPCEVALNYNKKVFFDCDVCHHTFSATPSHVNHGDWCPFCANKKRCPPETIDACTQCWRKTFASHAKAGSWSVSKNMKAPHQVALNDNRKYWFNCDVCHHLFDMAPNVVNFGNWCPFCKHKTEALVFNWCLEWDLTAIRGAKFDWCVSKTTGRFYPFDIFCPTFSTIIEVDGRQHFQNVGNWGDDLIGRQMRDVYKMQRAIQNNIRVIRVCQADILREPTYWKQSLCHALTSSSQQVLMLADNLAIYNEHRQLATLY